MEYNIEKMLEEMETEHDHLVLKAFEKELREKQQEWKKALPIASQTALIEINEILGES